MDQISRSQRLVLQLNAAVIIGSFIASGLIPLTSPLRIVIGTSQTISAISLFVVYRRVDRWRWWGRQLCLAGTPAAIVLLYFVGYAPNDQVYSIESRWYLIALSVLTLVSLGNGLYLLAKTTP
ncbi:hypothetical protein HGA91_05445 [candidate division WWE3 bacterium]|nr:hypothetical protein [candidate division WWE3 bacterium]